MLKKFIYSIIHSFKNNCLLGNHVFARHCNSWWRCIKDNIPDLKKFVLQWDKYENWQNNTMWQLLEGRWAWAAMDAMRKKCQVWTKNIWEIFIMEVTSELTLKRGVEICYGQRWRGNQRAELSCAKIWMCGKNSLFKE